MAAAGTAGTKKLTRSLEDYLEAIWGLIRVRRAARVRDIARRLHVGMPSVTAALKSLSSRKLVNYDPYELVSLTDAGKAAARKIARRHQVLRRFLTEVLGLDEQSADANACRMEHAVDDALMERLTCFAEFVEGCPRAGADWVKRFATRCGKGLDPDLCRRCIRDEIVRFRKAEHECEGNVS